MPVDRSVEAPETIQLMSTETKTHFVEGIAVYAQDFGGDEARRFAREGVYVGSESGHNCINLQQGNILLMPEKNMSISTDLAKINVLAEAEVFLIKSAKGLVIYDLFQTKPKQIIVTVDRQQIVLKPGYMLVLSEEKAIDFEHLQVNCHTIAYSKEKKIDLCTGRVNAFIADFSFASAITTIHPLMQMIQSSHPQDRLVVERLVKSGGIPESSVDLKKMVGDFEHRANYSAKEQRLSDSL